MKRKKIYVNGDINMLIEVDNLHVGDLHERQGGKCFFCGCEFKRFVTGNKNSKKGYTVDHFFPRSRNNPKKNNGVLACLECNQRKSGRNPTSDEIKKYLKLYDGVVFSGGIKIQNPDKED